MDDTAQESSVELLRSLMDELPDDLLREVFTHASWTERRGESYTRLAFLGDSVLGLALTAHLYPRLDASKYGAGRLTKIRAQAVCGRSCRVVAERLGLGERLRAAAPEGEKKVARLVQTERVLASVVEAVIGACFLHAGFERTTEAVVSAFMPQMEQALENPLDFKSALQEHLARHGEKVRYQVVEVQGLPHERTFEVAACVDGELLGTGRAARKKDAEQVAAREALQRLAEQGGTR